MVSTGLESESSLLRLFCLPNFLDCILIDSCKSILFLFLSNLFEETLILDCLFMRDRDLLVLQLILTPL